LGAVHRIERQHEPRQLAELLHSAHANIPVPGLYHLDSKKIGSKMKLETRAAFLFSSFR